MSCQHREVLQVMFSLRSQHAILPPDSKRGVFFSFLFE